MKSGSCRNVVQALLLVASIGMAQAQSERLTAGERAHAERAAAAALQLRELTAKALESHAEIQRLGERDRTSARATALERLKARAAAFRTLMREDPAEALSQSLSEETLRQLSAAVPEAADLLETHGSWQGTVQTRVFDHPDMQTHEVVHRLNTGSQTLDVYLAGPEFESQCGDIVVFEGVRQAETVAAATATVSTRAATTACSPTGQQNTVVLLVTFPGVTPTAGVTTQTVYSAVFGTSGRSLDGFWREASYDRAWATGNVYGWYTLDAAYTCDQPDQMLAAAIKAADADVNFQNYTRVVVVFPNPGSCSYAGLSDVGCASYSSSSDGTFAASASWLVSSYFTSNDMGVKLLAHEAGHQLGLMHSRSRDYGAEALGALSTTGTLSEYGDYQSTMGYWNLGHYTGSQKLKLGWQQSGSNVLTVQTSGTYQIQPTEVATSGAQTLKILRGTGNTSYIWVEYRQAIGSYDSTLNSQIFTGALIHYQDATTGSYSDLLDFTPSTTAFTDAALAAGQTWTDPYSNLSLTVQSATSSALTVAVNYGVVACTKTNPSVSLSPSNPSVYAGSSVAYTVAVTNNDPASCSARTFDISSALPSTWTGTLSANSVTLSPGGSGTVTLTKTVPASTAPGVYAVSASATESSYSATGSANATVLGEPAALALTPSVGASYALKSTVTMSAVLLSGANPVAGVKVTFSVTKPNGAVVTKTATTGATGKATATYKLAVRDPVGTYKLTVSATYNSKTVTGGPVTFTVN